MFNPRPTQIAALLVALLRGAAMGGAPTQEAQGSPHEGTRIATRVQELLEVPCKGHGVIDASILVRDEHFSKGDLKSQRLWDRTAELILAGSIPDELEDRTLEKITANDCFSSMSDGNCPYGTVVHRGRLRRSLWDAARSFDRQGQDPERVRRYTRAALVSCVNDRFNGIGIFGWIVRYEQAQRMLQIDDASLKELRRIADNFSDDSNEQNSARVEAAEALNRLCQPHAMPTFTIDVDKFFAAAALTWTGCGENSWRKWKLANMTWRLCCLARARNDTETLRRAEEFAAKMQAQTDNPHYKRWMSQAITLPGPVPKDSGVTVVRGPNDLKPKP
ncbi:MAG: hypothetical protein ACREJC_05425 [Tepidisphaeraceae bacterium]